MSIPYSIKINEQAAIPVSAETHIIGIVGTSTYAPGLIRLTQVPEQTIISSVSIPGYVEITSGSPTGTQFLVNYTTGVISFSTSQDGNSISVSYNGLGSEIAAEDVNELQEPLNTIANLSITYNWPSAPIVVWSLASNIVSDANISSLAAISLTKLQALNPNIVPVTNASGFLTSSSTTATELGYVHGVTSSIQTQLNGKQAAGSGTSLIGDVTTSPFNPLGAASTFAVLGDTAVTNTGFTVLTGDLGIYPGTSITGFPPGTYSGTLHNNDSVAHQAHTDATSAAAYLTALTPFTDITSTDLGGYTAFAGNYHAATTGTWSAGALTLDAQGNPNALFVFIFGTALTLPANASVVLMNGANANNVYFVTGTTFTFGATNTVNGNILAGTSITFAASSVLNGRALVYGPSGTTVTFPSAGTVTVPSGSGGIEVATIANGVITPAMITTSATADFTFPRDVFVTRNLGVGTSTTVASAIVEIDSTTKGFLPPRMSDPTTAIVSPAEGLIAYGTTTHQWFGYNGTSWVILG